MTKVIFVAFDNEERACEGDRALHDLHREGAITLYNDAVVIRERDGRERWSSRRPLGRLALWAG